MDCTELYRTVTITVLYFAFTRHENSQHLCGALLLPSQNGPLFLYSKQDFFIWYCSLWNDPLVHVKKTYTSWSRNGLSHMAIGQYIFKNRALCPKLWLSRLQSNINHFMCFTILLLYIYLIKRLIEKKEGIWRIQNVTLKTSRCCAFRLWRCTALVFA